MFYMSLALSHGKISSSPLFTFSFPTMFLSLWTKNVRKRSLNEGEKTTINWGKNEWKTVIHMSLGVVNMCQQQWEMKLLG